MTPARSQASDVLGISRRRGRASMVHVPVGLMRPSPKAKLAAYLICCLVIYVMGTTIYQSHFAGIFVPDVEVDESGRTRVRRRPHLHRQKLDPKQPTYVSFLDIVVWLAVDCHGYGGYQDGPLWKNLTLYFSVLFFCVCSPWTSGPMVFLDKYRTEVDAILEGYLTMIDLIVPPTALQGHEAYKGVMAKFCHIDWKLQQKAPHQVPMFNDLIRQSKMCDSTMVTVDLWDIVQQSKAYDSKLKAEISVVAPTGIIFHESRCGCILVASLFASFCSRRYAGLQ